MQVFKNGDKDLIKEEYDMINLGNHIRSSVVFITGGLSSGKSNLVKNLIHCQNPPFFKVQCIVADKETKEYEKGCDVIDNVNDIIDYKKLLPNQKLAIIFEDCEFENMRKRDIDVCEHLCRTGASHYGVSVYILAQNFFSCPPKIRRKVNVFYIHRIDDATMSLLHRNLSISKNKFDVICEEYLKNKYDSICIDLTGHPVVLRSNIFNKIM